MIYSELILFLAKKTEAMLPHIIMLGWARNLTLIPQGSSATQLV